MRFRLAFSTLFMFCSVVAADAKSVTTTQYCGVLGGFAKAVMSARQANVDMSKAIAIAEQNQRFKKIMRLIVLSAYEKPGYLTEKMKDRTIAEFSNEVQLSCFKGSER